VTNIRYLGRILSEDDEDLPACIRNIDRARSKWKAVSKVLKRDGASQRSFTRFYLVIMGAVLLYGSDTWVGTPHTRTKSFARFYLVIVSTVLFYGSDTWVVTKRMETLLSSFHNRCARHITKRFIRCTDEENDVWVTPSLTGVLEEALLLNLRPVMYYVRARRNGLLLRYVQTRPICHRCLDAIRISRPRKTFWNQPLPLQDLGV
jgi:hypothetical protein